MDGFCSLNTSGQDASQFCRRDYAAVDSSAGYAPYAGMHSLLFVRDQLAGEDDQKVVDGASSGFGTQARHRVRRHGETLKLAGE